MDNLHLIAIESEARRYCKRHDIRDYDSFQRIAHSMRHEAFRKEIQPFIHQKVRIESLRLIDHIKVNADGSLGETVRAPLPPALEDALKLWDEQIILSAQRWQLASSPVRTNDER